MSITSQNFKKRYDVLASSSKPANLIPTSSSNIAEFLNGNPLACSALRVQSARLLIRSRGRYTAFTMSSKWNLQLSVLRGILGLVDGLRDRSRTEKRSSLVRSVQHRKITRKMLVASAADKGNERAGLE